MSTLAQNLIIAAVVSSAAVYLVWLYIRRRRQPKCPECQVYKLSKIRRNGPPTTSHR